MGDMSEFASLALQLVTRVGYLVGKEQTFDSSKGRSMCEPAEQQAKDLTLEVLDTDLATAQREVDRARRRIEHLRRVTSSTPVADPPPCR